MSQDGQFKAPLDHESIHALAIKQLPAFDKTINY
jgi:hypothetical protein